MSATPETDPAVELRGPDFQETPEYNAAVESPLTSDVAKVWGAIATPLVEHVYGPIAEYSHTASVVAVTATLTLPRLLEIPLARKFVDSVNACKHGTAWATLAAKFFLKATDGADGAVARATHTSTRFGAAFDPLVDISGSASDAWAVHKLARQQGDTTVGWFMQASLATDAAAVLVGGIVNTATAWYAERKDIKLSDRDEPRAVAMAKAKFFVKAIGNTLLEAHYATQNGQTRRVLRTGGLAMEGVSVVVGTASLYPYGKSIISKIKKIREENKPLSS